MLVSELIAEASSGKHPETTSFALIFCLLYKIRTSCKNSDDLSIGFHFGALEKESDFFNYNEDDTRERFMLTLIKTCPWTCRASKSAIHKFR